MGYAFISYSTKNQATADAFRALLQKNGVETWMAPYNIPAGSEYAEVLYDALTDCACLVLLLTGDSQNSQWVKKEVNIAVSNCRPMIPVKLEDVELNSAMKLYLNDQQIVPVKTLDETSEGIRKVLSAIIAIAGQNKPVNTAPEEATKPAETAGPTQTEAAQVHQKNASKDKTTYRDGSSYEGDIVDGKPHGQGKMTYRDGNVYEGDFRNGRRTGKGKYTWSNGEFYEGDFVDGIFHGSGKRLWANGDTYEGDWLFGKRTGLGTYTWRDGTVYQGDFVDGHRTGYGIYKKTDGSVQQGRFEDGIFKG